MRLFIILMSSLGTPMSVFAQLYFFEGDIGRVTQPPSKPVIADVTSTLTAETPWGPFVQSETGKYWRSRDGKVRQDTAFGLSRVVDLGKSPRTEAQIDHVLRRISVVFGPIDRRARYEDVTGSDFTLGNNTTKPKKIGEAVVENLKVTIRKGQLRRGGESTDDYEIWTADDLKMIVLFKLTSGSTELVQRLHNIRQVEPDASVFELPAGYRSVTNYPRSPGSPCLRQEVGISGAPRPEEVNLSLCQP